MIEQILLVGEIALLSAAMPLAVVAALGFRGSPFGKVVVPLPFIVLGFLLADASLLLSGNGHPVVYYPLATVAVFLAIYAAFNAMMLLTERRPV